MPGPTTAEIGGVADRAHPVGKARPARGAMTNAPERTAADPAPPKRARSAQTGADDPECAEATGPNFAATPRANAVSRLRPCPTSR